MVCIQVSQFEGIKDLSTCKIYCSFSKDIRYNIATCSLAFSQKIHYVLK